MKGENEMVEWYWYAEAKRREQERLEEAETRRIERSLQVMHMTKLADSISYFLVWFGGRLVASGTKLQMQNR